MIHDTTVWGHYLYLAAKEILKKLKFKILLYSKGKSEF